MVSELDWEPDPKLFDLKLIDQNIYNKVLLFVPQIPVYEFCTGTYFTVPIVTALVSDLQKDFVKCSPEFKELMLKPDLNSDLKTDLDLDGYRPDCGTPHSIFLNS